MPALQGALDTKLTELTEALEAARGEAAQAKEQAAKDLAAAKVEMHKLLDQNKQHAIKVSPWVVMGALLLNTHSACDHLAVGFLSKRVSS